MFVAVLFVTIGVCASLAPSTRTGAKFMYRNNIYKNTFRYNHVLHVTKADEMSGKSSGKMSDPTIDTPIMFTTKELQTYTDEEYDVFLEDMIFGNDLQGYLQRRAKEVVTEDFLDFVEYKLDESDDDDEKEVLSAIIGMIEEKLRQTDGLGADSDIIFETRLDKLLFAPPSNRKKYIEVIFGLSLNSVYSIYYYVLLLLLIPLIIIINNHIGKSRRIYLWFC